MTRALSAILFVLAFCVPAAARQEAARKFDDLGGINYSDLLARLDNFAVELQNEPASRGVIVVHPLTTDRLPGWYVRRAYWARGYLTKGRGLGEGRVSVLTGGFRDKAAFELWFVPAGAETPVEPLDWAVALAREKNPILFDRFVRVSRPRIPEIQIYEDYGDEKDAYEPFVSALRADPASRGLIIAYAAPRGARGRDRRLAAREKLSLMKLHAIGADRVQAIGGGVRKNRTIEYWIVPPGAEPPKPTPPARPLKRRRRGR